MTDAAGLIEPGPVPNDAQGQSGLLPVSLIIVSRHRTKALLCALTAVMQQDHPEFELIVVADPAAAAAVRATGIAVKLAEFDRANISTARNIGLQLASAPVVAFLDDDAVPEPTWLSRLAAPFGDTRVTQAGGYVLGRSGLRWQWRANFILADATDEPFDAPSGTTLHPGTATRAIKTQGTCCAFRRDALLDLGGFDPAFRFYLDEADVNLRLAARGGLAAVVPGAVVHHATLPSARRRADRTPMDLSDMGASIAAFLTRHAPGDAGALARQADAQRRRLLRRMLKGALRPRDVLRLMVTLRDGFAKGAGPPAACAPMTPTSLPMIALPRTGPRPGHVIVGDPRDRQRLESEARIAAAGGRIVTLFLFARGLRPQRMVFHCDGFWLQSGGRFGRSVRTGPRIVFQKRATRIMHEVARLSAWRPMNDPISPR